jgi:hypothetical protein
MAVIAAGPIALLNHSTADAAIRCNDGTYSSSSTRRGACSHHGGIANNSPTTPTSSSSSCDPNYTGACVPANVSDVDCAGGSGNGPYYVQGPVYVVGTDHYGLDADHDGVGCERPGADSQTTPTQSTPFAPTTPTYAYTTPTYAYTTPTFAPFAANTSTSTPTASQAGTPQTQGSVGTGANPPGTCWQRQQQGPYFQHQEQGCS